MATYLDDICIFSGIEEEPLTHMRLVLAHLRSYKLYSKPSKYEWLQTSEHFLGHQLSLVA